MKSKFKSGGDWFALVLLAGGLIWVSGCDPGKGKVDENRFTALGKVMAERTTQLCQGNGSVVLVVSKNDYQQSTPAGMTFDAFCQTLEKNIQVAATEKVPTPEILMPMCDPLTVAQFAELLQKFSGADYLVSFVGVPPLPPAQIAQLPSPRPKVVEVVTHTSPTKALFAGKVICLAALNKRGNNLANSGGSTQEVFDSNYQLITPETTSLLSR